MTNPACTHCGYKFTEDEVFFGSNVDTDDGGVSKLKCKACKETFYVQCVHAIAWEQCGEDGEEL